MVVILIGKCRAGFTLTEFMVTLAVAGIFMAVGVPAYYSLIQNNKAVGMANKLSASFSYARMEAIKRGIRVSVCPAANAGLNACGTAAQWAQGWIVFLDANNNNTIDSAADIVKIQEALPTGTAVNANQGIVSYDSSGFVTSGALNMTISASGCSGTNARALAITSSGRLTIAKMTCP
ncbi:type IV pre-pilin [Legionella erythra]|uniref:Type II secretion system protein H n=1 Tax=Legionella erythra TaxID=448 RepID=A0A0W0TLV1_LEGER|nr:GspH/FimT family pseudopilin [Legionella erythra]KTC96594.1 type IV pre-pilin [Legionella erythra]